MKTGKSCQTVRKNVRGRKGVENPKGVGPVAQRKRTGAGKKHILSDEEEKGLEAVWG